MMITTRTSTALFFNTCIIVNSKRKYDHSGLNGVTMWKGPGCKGPNVPLCYIVCSCLVIFTVFTFLCITTSVLLYNVMVRLLRLASSYFRVMHLSVCVVYTTALLL
jgi:hypothetical protein